MSEEFDWDFSGEDDAKAKIRAAVRYLLKDAAGSDRGDDEDSGDPCRNHRLFGICLRSNRGAQGWRQAAKAG